MVTPEDLRPPHEFPGFFLEDGERSMPTSPFAIEGPNTFTPRQFPDTIRVTKERELNRESGLCGGEQVSDTGSKNRDIHIAGKIRGQNEKAVLDALADSAAQHDLSCVTWSGEVRIKNVEYEGPTGWHPPSSSFYWDYSMDLVSTGRDEVEDFDQIIVDEEALAAANPDDPTEGI